MKFLRYLQVTLFSRRSHGRGLFNCTHAHYGFTLIELSIVLVIIGLIIGGILVGQDLIKAAEVRGQLGQIEKYNTLVNAFRGKYGYLPGDIPPPYATQFGFLARSGTTADGDGDGILSGCVYQWASFGCETALFWKDLGNADLVEGDFSNIVDGSGSNMIISATFNPLPLAKIGNGGRVAVITGNAGGQVQFILLLVQIISFLLPSPPLIIVIIPIQGL